MFISISNAIGSTISFGRYVLSLINSFKQRVYADDGEFEAEACLVAQLQELQDIALLQSASLVITPSAVEENKLFSIIPTDGSGDLVVTRATTATRVNSDGLIEVVPYNLLQYSEQFDNALWTKVNTTITANTTISPDGTQDADTMSVLDINSRVEQTPTIGSGTYTFSVYVKVLSQTTAGNMRLQAVVDSANSSVIFTPTNEWQKVTATYTATSSINSFRIRGFGFGGTIAIWGAQLVTGTSAKEYFPTTDRLDVPRLDYTNSSCPSILVEPQRTNLLLRSEEFDNASWVKGNSIVTPNADISPDGLLNSDKLIPNNLALLSSISNFARQPITKAASSIQYTYSVFAKQSGLNSIRLFSSSSIVTDNASATFLLVDGSISISAVASGNFSGASASVVNYENGWYRCTLTFTTNSETTLTNRIIPTDSVLTISDGTSGIYIWGAQLEQGSNATSYIPTVASTVTRNQDVISKTGISSLIGQTEGTIYIDFNKTKNNLSILSIDDGTTNNRIFLEGTGTSTGLRVRITNGGTTTVDNTSNVLQNGINKIALIYANNNVSLYRNGVLIFNDNSATIPNTSILRIGSNVTNLFQLDDSINSAVIWKTALTDQECINLTTI